MTKLEKLKKIEELIDVWGSCDWDKSEEKEIREMLTELEAAYKESDEYTKELIRIKEDEIKYQEKELEELKNKLISPGMKNMLYAARELKTLFSDKQEF